VRDMNSFYSGQENTATSCEHNKERIKIKVITCNNT